VVAKIQLLSAEKAKEETIKCTGQIPNNFKKVTSIPTNDESLVVHAMIPIGFSLVASKVWSSKQDSIICFGTFRVGPCQQEGMLMRYPFGYT
jgi:hypothetical protein